VASLIIIISKNEKSFENNFFMCFYIFLKNICQVVKFHHRKHTNSESLVKKDEGTNVGANSPWLSSDKHNVSKIERNKLSKH